MKIKSTPKHTPTPWKYDKNGPGNNIRDNEDCIIAHANSYYKEYRANACFIVRAVNSHDDLVELLRDLRFKYFGEEYNIPNKNVIWDRVDAAILKAEGRE